MGKEANSAIVFKRKDKLKIQRYYIVDQLPVREIAEKTDFEPRQLYDLVHREGWAKDKKREDAKLSQMLSNRNSSLASENDACMESARIRAAGLLEKGFDHAEGSLDGKEFSASMSGSKVAFDIYRQAAGIDSQAKGNTTLNLSVYYGNPVGDDTPESQEVTDI